MNMIEIEGLTKRFGTFTAVDHVSLQVEKGIILGFLGPNGAGKSTTIRMLCTLLRPTEGSARVAGYDIVREQDQVRRHIGLVAEKLILYDQLTAEENLTLFARLNNLPDDEIKKAIDKWLVRLNMDAWRKNRVGTFSTGMKQRINVIRALLHHPDVIFLDEPTLGLDPQTTRTIHDFIVELAQEGITIILTTHDMVEAGSLCQRIAIIDHSKVVALDTTANLKKLISEGDATVIDVEIANFNDDMLSRIKMIESIAAVERLDSQHLRLHTHHKDNLGPIITVLGSLGANIQNINTVSPSLEDVFLHLTGRETRDKASGSVPSVGARRWGGGGGARVR